MKRKNHGSSEATIRSASICSLTILLSLCSPLAMHTMLTARCAHHSSRSPCSQSLLQVTRDAQQSFKLGPRTAAGVDQDSRNHVKTNEEMVDTITSDVGLSDDVFAQLDAEQAKMDKVTRLSTSLDACPTLVELRVCLCIIAPLSPLHTHNHTITHSHTHTLTHTPYHLYLLL